jgi:hypothetical protein
MDLLPGEIVAVKQKSLRGYLKNIWADWSMLVANQLIKLGPSVTALSFYAKAIKYSDEHLVVYGLLKHCVEQLVRPWQLTGIVLLLLICRHPVAWKKILSNRQHSVVANNYMLPLIHRRRM